MHGMNLFIYLQILRINIPKDILSNKKTKALLFPRFPLLEALAEETSFSWLGFCVACYVPQHPKHLIYPVWLYFQRLRNKVGETKQFILELLLQNEDQLQKQKSNPRKTNSQGQTTFPTFKCHLSFSKFLTCGLEILRFINEFKYNKCVTLKTEFSSVVVVTGTLIYLINLLVMNNSKSSYNSLY